ncbi:hypothetical protein MTX26_27700 [Bradyrhizobium sp. ISRA443]|uniref:amino acid--tRNA ligase-related protein n=1 Tax=unclassified Bradyrhizobium TaxID=2631580 RepID=UPI00247A9C3F|nr:MULTISPECIES: amino acid--tRNA ligase-related protein [unclassified Bradyrhizobium]WGR93502.1 hypothetical protein MTX20_02560 [Bradyrhizobium sp. ISRA435]WGR98051.1 hypothetical protein MTX23_27690 [Bradyrhizobium sp. ISRA436]WGS04940.1 hypothetical protein MTX18_27695 [Bradyrhizobium sp. ISRA437]WGS11824.1 hypothetical protein MTX26_27700 [Bradyrhizobium sp. ISRA443]
MSTEFDAAYTWTADVLASLRHSLSRGKFDEILPAILSDRYEPGARHSIAVLGDRTRPQVSKGPDGVVVRGAEFYYLPVSHCVEKQLSLEYLDRVYCVAPCVRLLMAGEDISRRHLYSFFQVEIEWKTTDADDVYTAIETLLQDFSTDLLARRRARGELPEEAERRIAQLGRVPYERLPFAAARQRVQHVGGASNPHAAGDLTHSEETALSNAADAPFWLTEYPEGVRDSLYLRTPNGLFATYDLILPHGYGEVATGGLRPDSADAILAQARTLGEEPHPHYADWKRRTAIQTGGLGFGLERLVRYCAGAESILDLRVAHDQGPNAKIVPRFAAAAE